MSEFSFNSQVCTDRVQSERLLALGIKKETADMMWDAITIIKGKPVQDVHWSLRPYYYPKKSSILYDNEEQVFIPAWSLHRLIEMADSTKTGEEYREDDNELWFAMDRCYCWNNHEAFYSYNLYDSLINCIEWLIKKGYFNKDYLENGK